MYAYNILKRYISTTIIESSWFYWNINKTIWRYQAIKQKEQSNLKFQKTRQLHEIRKHKYNWYYITT